MKKLRKILIRSSLVLLLLAILGGSVAIFANFSDGYRVGRVIKLSRKGYVFKTWEGQLNLEALSQDEGIWEFSVERGDDEIRNQIDEAVEEGYRVKLYYKEKYFQFDWRGKTKYFIYNVEKIES
ncbi:MAG: 6-phosphogluconate dehydrogenase [Bacteroidota bacterium]